MSRAFFGWLDEGRARASRLLLPAALRRADRALQLRWPLFWRSHLMPLTWLVLLAVALVVIGALAIPMDSTTVWTQDQLGNASTSLMVLALIVALYWVRLTLMYALNERRLGDYAWLAGSYAVGFLLLMTPEAAFHAVMSHKVAHVVPNAEFTKDWRLHREYGFWCCADSFDEQTLARENEAGAMQRSLVTGCKCRTRSSPTALFTVTTRRLSCADAHR